VKLNPEGLGEVQLTVQVKDGRVNVAMSAETHEAKKALESAVSDLRESLTSHKLSVEKIHVDVGNQTSSDSRSQSDSQQRGLDLRADVGREQARQFMGQFREDTASRRDPFIEMPGIRGYVQPNNTPGPIPAYESGATVRRYSGAMTGERVNLVG
jgi:flagellar hook-length control protein FliK